MQDAYGSFESLAPSRVVGRRVREQREGRGWSQDRLARDLADVGVHMYQTGVARLEKTGPTARSVTQEDLFALAFVLGVPPVLLQLPADDERVEIVRSLAEERDRVHAWIVGRRPLDAGRDPQRYRAGTAELQPRPSQPHLGAFLRSLADLIDSQDLDGQEQAILAAREYLQGALRGIRMIKARYSDKEAP
jgi:transcriptional regulator with XRE-family HTH domain